MNNNLIAIAKEILNENKKATLVSELNLPQLAIDKMESIKSGSADAGLEKMTVGNIKSKFKRFSISIGLSEESVFIVSNTQPGKYALLYGFNLKTNRVIKDFKVARKRVDSTYVDDKLIPNNGHLTIQFMRDGERLSYNGTDLAQTYEKSGIGDIISATFKENKIKTVFGVKI